MTKSRFYLGRIKNVHARRLVVIGLFPIVIAVLLVAVLLDATRRAFIAVLESLLDCLDTIAEVLKRSAVLMKSND